MQLNIYIRKAVNWIETQEFNKEYIKCEKVLQIKNPIKDKMKELNCSMENISQTLHHPSTKIGRTF